MSQTFLKYLTLPNPKTNSENCKPGKSTRSPVKYSPDKYQEWTEFTLGNVPKSLKKVLQGKMTEEPRIRDARDVSELKTEILEEDTVSALAAEWNEHVVQHALNGTHDALCKAIPGGNFVRNKKINFARNSGHGHVRDPETKQNQRPDWCVSLGGLEGRTNLVPGDIKPAIKWKSEWITSKDSNQRRDADDVLQQVVKYMRLGKTRYSFILSEEELVPVRLSKFYLSESDKRRRAIQQDEEGRFLESMGGFEDDDDAYLFSQNRADSGPDALYGGDGRRIGWMLEYCRVPWARSGTRNLTINLTLWWLSVLAVQGKSIKGYKSYTPLEERVRGHSPEFFEEDEEEGETGLMTEHEETEEEGPEGWDETEVEEGEQDSQDGEDKENRQASEAVEANIENKRHGKLTRSASRKRGAEVIEGLEQIVERSPKTRRRSTARHDARSAVASSQASSGTSSSSTYPSIRRNASKLGNSNGALNASLDASPNATPNGA